MTDAANTPLNEAIERALAAAEAATDAAAEAQAAARAAPAAALAPQPAPAPNSRLVVLAGAAAVGALLSLGAAGVVYVRSVADLREAAELQTTAASKMIEQIRGLADLSVAFDPATLARKPDVEAIGVQVGGLVAPATPEDLAKLRADLMAAISEITLRLGALGERPAEAGTAELTMMLGETLRRLDALPKTPAAAAEKPAARPPAKPAAPRPSAARKPEPTPYRYP